MGITYKNNKGEICSTCDSLLVQNLDEIPIFPYHLFDDNKNEGSGKITDFFAGDADYNKSNPPTNNKNLGGDYSASYDFGVITGARG